MQDQFCRPLDGQWSNRTSSRCGQYFSSTLTSSQTFYFASTWNGSSAGLQQALQSLLTDFGFLLGVDGFK